MTINDFASCLSTQCTTAFAVYGEGANKVTLKLDGKAVFTGTYSQALGYAKRRTWCNG